MESNIPIMKTLISTFRRHKHHSFVQDRRLLLDSQRYSFLFANCRIQDICLYHSQSQFLWPRDHTTVSQNLILIWRWLDYSTVFHRYLTVKLEVYLALWVHTLRCPLQQIDRLQVNEQPLLSATINPMKALHVHLPYDFSILRRLEQATSYWCSQ